MAVAVGMRTESLPLLLVALLLPTPGRAGSCANPSGGACVNCDNAFGRCSFDADCRGSLGCACDGAAADPGLGSSANDYGGASVEQVCGQARTVPTGQYRAPEEEVRSVTTLMMFVGTFMFSLSGVWCCIRHKRRTLDAEPSPAAWVSCLLIFFFAGPVGACFMWVPFALDACYRIPVPRARHAHGHRDGGQQQDHPPVLAMAVAQPQQQPITAVAVAEAVPDQQHVTAVVVSGESWDGTHGQPIVTGTVMRP